MSQHDFNVANQGFPAFRTDMNSAFAALASNSSGATAPSTTYAYQWWYDTTTNLLKMRNTDNDAWISVGSFNQTTDRFFPVVDGTPLTATGTELNYVDGVTSSIQTQLDNKVALGGSAVTLLGSLATTSGATVTLSGLNLTGYNFLVATFNNVSCSSAVSNLLMASLQVSGSTAASAEVFHGLVFIDLFTGQFTSTTSHASTASPTSQAGEVWCGDSNIITSSTSISFATQSGTFDAGSIRVYGF
jgi:hypothetical protein